MHKTMKVAVIGTGKLGSRHAEVYSKLPGVELVGVCDILEHRARETAELCRSKPYKDYHELLKKVDAASIVVPSELHYRISKDFLLSGAHLLIEKPMATSLDQADELLSIARRHNLIVQVGHIERFNSAIRTIKNVIKIPRFIECHRLGMFDPRVTDVGVTLDLMIHDIDIVLDLIQSPVQTVDAVGAFILSKTEDIANARIRFANRSVCNLTASRVSQEVTRRIRIFQDDAYITIDYVNQAAEIYTKNSTHIHHKKIDITKSDSLREELTHFIECLSVKKRPIVAGEEGRRALALALEITQQITDAKNSIRVP